MNLRAVAPEARSALADNPLQSLDTRVDGEAKQQWREEIPKRIANLDSGAVQPVPWPEVRSRLARRIQR